MTHLVLRTLVLVALIAGASIPDAAGASERERGYISNVPDGVREGDRAAGPSSAGAAAAPGEETPIVAACPAPCTATGFEALSNVDDTTPPDPTGAAGDNHVVAAVNTSFAVYSRAGATEVAPTYLLELFPGAPANEFIYDPKVVYDPYDDTYVLVFLGDQRPYKNRSWIQIVTIPDATAADTDTWCARRINGDQKKDGKKVYADYTGLGYDQDRVYISTNQYPFGFGYEGAQILAIRKLKLYDCNQTLTKRVFAKRATLAPDGSSVDSIAPATVVGTAPTDFYLFSEQHSCNNTTCRGSKLVLWRIRQTAGGLRLANAYVPVGRFKIPPWGTQEGGDGTNPSTFWDPGDLRLTNTFFDSDTGMAYTAHAVEKNIGISDGYRESTARWYEVQTAPSLEASALSRSGYVGLSGLDMGWPAVATDSLGNVFMTVSGAGYLAGEYLSAWSAVIPPGPPSTTAPERLSFEGDARYYHGSGVQRWGDYNAINRDPIDGTRVWSFNASARKTVGTITRNFVEVVHQLYN